MTKKLWPLLFLILWSVVVFAQDSTARVNSPGTSDDFGPDPGLSMLLLIIIVGFITSVILGLIAISTIFFLLTALVAGGVISFSVIMGIYHKSLLTGVKYFVVTASALLGGGSGLIGYILFILLRHIHFHLHYPIFLSMVGGMAGGLLGGLLALNFVSKLYERLKPK